MLELFGVALLAGSIASVAIAMKRAHRPGEVRSQNPMDFELTAVESYNRLFKFLSAGKIGAHTWTVIETVDPLYIVAEIAYRDESGGKCDARVTFDVVEGYKSTTTIRWSCRFLKPCDKNVAAKMEQLLDSWVQTCLMPKLAVPPSAMPAQLLDPINVVIPDSAPESKHLRALKDAMQPLQGLLAKATKQSNMRSPDPLQFQVPLTDAYRLIHAVMSRGEAAGYIWQIKDAVQDAYISSQMTLLNQKQKGAADALVHFDFTTTSPDSVTIIWSCELKQWQDEQSSSKTVQLINAWLNAVLLPQQQIHSDALRIPAAIDTPIVSTIKSRFPREFAYLKLLPKMSANTDLYTTWKMKECQQGSSIAARVEHRSSKKPGAYCTADVHIEFSDDSGNSVIRSIYRFTPDSDSEIFEEFQKTTEEWMKLIVQR